jgi:hypothetical protein
VAQVQHILLVAKVHWLDQKEIEDVGYLEQVIPKNGDSTL